MSDYPAEAPYTCDLCPRLRDYLEESKVKNPDWFNGPVPSFGDENAQILIVGLAPGITGANRTGRPFTGDYAGDLLYATLDKFNLSTGTYDMRPDDELELKNTMITNAVRCVPPGNKPLPIEINTCRAFLISKLKAMSQVKVVIALGRVAHESIVRALGGRLKEFPFGHMNEHNIGPYRLIDSYHCSRYNTNTGRLTTEMFEGVFEKALEALEPHKKRA